MDYQAIERVRLNLRDLYFKGRSAFGGSGDYVLCNSFPKSGTHLLSQILTECANVEYWDDIVSVQSLSGVMNTRSHIKSKVLSFPKGCLVKSHLSYDLELSSFLDSVCSAQFFIYRDPRDIVVSHANWVINEPRIFLHKYYKESLCTFDKCLEASIQGVSIGDSFGMNISNPSLGVDFSRWLPWLEKSNVYSIRFEDIVGERGDGDENKRLDIIADIFRNLNLDLPDDYIEKFSSNNLDPSKSHTYRKGRKGGLGGWSEAFTPKHKELFKSVAGDLLIKLGYETDYNW
ncbi:Sulfotransferase domain-containing protein [Amphritea atlantica]|uniref:Sulfotransferase domain-containing protein n=1 Tax=Amphritea atlantica TaxID=355243 RepID=A0A1H9LUU9_9GAMM|nr:sulfotransferase domain-containing protein [Amphritea atlantica]SER14945.1 Sulfotransferase domain-containing protein [Amphritea atlantica]